MGERVAGPEIERLIHLLARLPGLGPRSARRAALHLIRKREELLVPLASALNVACEKIVTCRICGNIDTCDPCTLCNDERRDRGTLVVVETVADLWALERAAALSARYHVLGGCLSPLDGIGPKDLNLASLAPRVARDHVTEVILALNATVDGQTTAHYITGLLAEFEVKITRLAHGVPVGGELDYLDEGTLTAAIRSRTVF
jgi:recombination protein RecR